MDLKDIESKIINIDTNFPPVDKWNPPLCEGPFLRLILTVIGFITIQL